MGFVSSMKTMLVGIAFTFFFVFNALFGQDSLEIILEGGFNAHPSNIARFNSPIFTADGNIYVSYIDSDLQTVVAQKKNGSWKTSVVSEITQDDPYHNQPSLAVDADGYIHVVYNMHATPWQYSVSMKPHDISEWDFKGQYAGENPGFTSTDPSQCSGDCYNDWQAEGKAAIPGNQVSYPFMSVDRNRTIYVSYRECFHCDASYFERQKSAGISKYDVKTKTWRRLAGVRPWATDENFVALGVHFFFDGNNRMHVSWIWGNHYTEDESSDAFFFNPNYPSYTYSDDGGNTFYSASGKRLSLPLNFAQTESIIEPEWIERPEESGYFWGYTEISALPNGNPVAVLFPRTITDGRVKKSVFVLNNGWSEPRFLPWGAEDLMVDSNGRFIAISSGIRMHISSDQGVSWENIEIDLTESYNIILDYAYSMESDNVRFWGFKEDGANSKIRIYTLKFKKEEVVDIIPPRAPINVQVKESDDN